MLTMPRRILVSLAVLTVTVALGACVHPAQSADRPSSLRGDPLTIRFDNESRQHVHVYLIGERREWLLGRVEAGAIRTLRIPHDAFTEDQRFARLAVIGGEHMTLQTARNSRATFSLAQPVVAMLSQRWLYAEGSLTPSRR